MAYQVFRETGIVKFFKDANGYGFIERPNGPDLFVHFSEIQQNGSGRRTLNSGDKVEFEVGQGKKGPCALSVRKI